MTPEDEEFERIAHEQKIRAEWLPKGPMPRPWAYKTIEERLDAAILYWGQNLARIDHDGTALNHDTYDKDPVRFSTAEAYDGFVRTLHAIKDRT